MTTLSAGADPMKVDQHPNPAGEAAGATPTALVGKQVGRFKVGSGSFCTRLQEPSRPVPNTKWALSDSGTKSKISGASEEAIYLYVYCKCIYIYIKSLPLSLSLAQSVCQSVCLWFQRFHVDCEDRQVHVLEVPCSG